jgi:hypothetical protein
MSGAVTLSTIATAAAIGTAYSIYSGERASNAQEKAQNQARANADRQAAAADQAFNRANQKQPDASAILSASGQAGRPGASSTMLTGPAGITPDMLNLGKNTLLGQ